MLPPPLPHQIRVLETVLDRVNVLAADGGFPPVVIFCLDGTLFDTRPRTVRVLHDFADEIASTQPEVAAALHALAPPHVHRLLGDTLSEAGITSPTVTRDISAFWYTYFHHSDYLAYDAPEPGAADYARRLHAAGATVAYLTTRDIPGMLTGTVRALRDHGFPVAEPGVVLALKPDPTITDEAHMRETLPELARGGEVVAAFAADRAVCTMALGYFPDALVGMMDTWEFDPPGPESGLDHVRDFRLR